MLGFLFRRKSSSKKLEPISSPTSEAVGPLDVTWHSVESPSDLGSEVDDEAEGSQNKYGDGEQSMTSSDLEVKLRHDTEIGLMQSQIQMYSKEREEENLEIEALVTQLRKVRDDFQVSATARFKIEKELDDCRLKNNQLTQELWDKSDTLEVLERESTSSASRLLEAHHRLQDLEREINDLRKQKDDLVAEHEAVEIERDEELRALQNHLDGALEQRVKIQQKMDTEFKTMRNSFAAQEQQLMDDFEWKLRQIEASCKGKLRQKEIETEDKLAEVKTLIQTELSSEREKLIEDRQTVEDQMRLVCHYKAYEPELFQLRGLTHEQQRALRSAARQLEQDRFNERVLHEEIRSSRKILEKEKSSVATSLAQNHRRLANIQRELEAKWEQEKNELNSKWESRLEQECRRLRDDLEQVQEEEMALALEAVKRSKDEEVTKVKESWTKEKIELEETINSLKSNLAQLETTNRSLATELKSIDEEKVAILTKVERTRRDHAQEMESLRRQYTEARQEVMTLEQKLTPAPTQTLNPPIVPGLVNQTDSGCCDEDSSEESDYDLDEEASHDRASGSVDLDDTDPETMVHHLRVEVASLQGSIEKLTTNLVIGQEGQGSEEESEPE